jgi:hypothetical protein
VVLVYLAVNGVLQLEARTDAVLDRCRLALPSTRLVYVSTWGPVLTTVGGEPQGKTDGPGVLPRPSILVRRKDRAQPVSVKKGP